MFSPLVTTSNYFILINSWRDLIHSTFEKMSQSRAISDEKIFHQFRVSQVYLHIGQTTTTHFPSSFIIISSSSIIITTTGHHHLQGVGVVVGEKNSIIIITSIIWHTTSIIIISRVTLGTDQKKKKKHYHSFPQICFEEKKLGIFPRCREPKKTQSLFVPFLGRKNTPPPLFGSANRAVKWG
jgi:hypothetical protein